MPSPQQPPAETKVGSVLNGTWRILQLIGEGGLATVYEAEGLHAEGKRAIKLLHAHLLAERALVERFYQEAKACFALRHPNIGSVEAYDYTEAGEPYIVMELLNGLSLAQHLTTYAPMRLGEASSVMLGILQALEFAHGHGVVHRDLKPGNLFLVPKADNKYRVKVLDFGVAKFIENAGSTASRTRTGEVLGTPGFMSPEQLKNAKEVDGRADLWSAAVVFYLMLTHNHPFGNGNHLARMLSVLRDPPLPLSEFAPHLQSLEAFFNKALQKDPDARFASAAEMAEAIGQFSEVPGVEVPVSSETTVSLELRPASHEVPQAAQDLDEQPTRVTVPPTQPSAFDQQLTVAAMQSSQATESPVRLGFKPVGKTQVSALHQDDRIEPAPRVFVEMARPEDGLSVVWWGVALVAAIAFGVGVGVGFLLGGGG